MILTGLSLVSQGQKTFRRSCDCEYMEGGKCAYTLLLPVGEQGQGVCPQNGGDADSSTAQMSEQLQQTVTELKGNYTALLERFSSQATMLNQVYSTLVNKLMTCPLLQQCAMVTPPTMPNFTVPDIAVDVTVPDIAVPTIEVDVPEMPEVTMPDIKIPDEVTMPEVTMPPVTMPDVEIPKMQCVDICPDLDEELDSLRSMTAQVNATITRTTSNITSVVSMIRNLNATVTELGLRVLTGGGGGRGDGDREGAGGDGRFPAPGVGIPDINLNPPGDPPGPGVGAIDLGNLVQGIQALAQSGALCLQKGPLVAGSMSSLPDDSITASSVFNDQHVASRVRINAQQEGDLMGAWCPGIHHVPFYNTCSVLTHS